MLRNMAAVLSFLTILPAGHHKIEDAAKCMPAFPLAGLGIGAVLGGLGLGAYYLGADPLLVSLLVAGAAAILTGLHHTDGLSDFADGLMAKGGVEKKIAAMRDAHAGTAGVAAIVLYFVGMVAVLSTVGGIELFLAVICAEISAKLAMGIMAAVSRPAAPGTGSLFVHSMRGPWRLLAVISAAIVPVVLLGGYAGLGAVMAGAAVSLMLSLAAWRSMGGITGDGLGASNELGRLAAVIGFVSL